ncbi:hypothetical protein ANN_20243 [Periplaneta americana]|uniref:Histone-lysine N-methyltransferase SETMAR n=1 Tax=Periplaneta americana TaxID=6978 RepID=A0ABQ8SCR7_PERAM|nr:hypothetical protein ANN_20243 [Periplaneta americana]
MSPHLSVITTCGLEALQSLKEAQNTHQERGKAVAVPLRSLEQYGSPSPWQREGRNVCKIVDNDGSFRQRVVIKFLVKEEKSAAEINPRLQRAYGDVCMGASSVRRWVKHLEGGNTSIQDEPRRGRPQTASRNAKRKELMSFGMHFVLKIRRALREKLPGKKIILQHDNAWPHTDLVTVEKIRTFGWEALSHPPYSPDLALPSFRFCKGAEEETILRDMLLEINDSCEQYRMEINVNKTKTMIIRTKIKKEEKKELAGSMTEKELSPEECSGRNGEREKNLWQKKISDDRDDIKIYGSYTEIERKAENKKD